MVSRLVATTVLGAALVAPEIASACSPVPKTAPLSIGMSPASPSAGAEVRLTGGAGADSYAWDLDGDGQFDDATGKEVTATFAAGEQTVRAQAVTALGLLTDSRTFTVHAWNGTPTGTVTATPYSARVGAPVKVTAEGSDPDGSRVQTALDLDADGTFETAGSTGTATFATPGERVIRARFTDDGGATAVATTTLDVHAGNIAPTVSVHVGNSCFSHLRALAIDPDGEIARYEFDVNGDGTYEADRGTSPDGPPGQSYAALAGVRVTDDSGATATTRTTPDMPGVLPGVAEVGKPVKLSVQFQGVDGWDADGDGDFDDGTGKEITFTYPAVGTYEVRVRHAYGTARSTISVRAAADIAVPTARWLKVTPGRPSVASSLAWDVQGPAGAATTVDLDGDGVFEYAPPDEMVSVPEDPGPRWTFNGPTTIALKATDPGGRTAVATTQVPYGAGNFGPDATMLTSDVDNLLPARYSKASVYGGGSDVDIRMRLNAAWDSDNDGEYDDGELLDRSATSGQLPPSFGLRVTDQDGETVTLRRSLTPIVPLPLPPIPIKASPWLQVSAKQPRLATLLRRGMTVDVKCTQPKCKTTLKATVDAKTARKLGLRSRTVATKSVSGTKRVTLKLTAKARKALKGVRSVKLKLTATATAEGGARSTWTKTLTIKKVADRS